MSPFWAGVLVGALGWVVAGVVTAVVVALAGRQLAAVPAPLPVDPAAGLDDVVDLTAFLTNPDALASPGSIARAIVRDERAQLLYARFGGKPWHKLDERTREHYRQWSDQRPLWLDPSDPCVCPSRRCYGATCDACRGLSVDTACPADPQVPT